jgi:hypothetical protein
MHNIYIYIFSYAGTARDSKGGGRRTVDKNKNKNKRNGFDQKCITGDIDITVQCCIGTIYLSVGTSRKL